MRFAAGLLRQHHLQGFCTCFLILSVSTCNHPMLAKPTHAGVELRRWKRSYRAQDLGVTADGAALVIASSDRQIRILR